MVFITAGIRPWKRDNARQTLPNPGKAGHHSLRLEQLRRTRINRSRK